MPTTTVASRKKQKKPYPDYPLTPRSDGRWQKKCRGKTYFFRGSWQEALSEWKRIEDDAMLGRPAAPDEPCMKELIYGFLRTKQNRVDSGELSERSYRDYQKTCSLIRNEFGLSRPLSTLRSQDFEQLRASLAKTRALRTLGNEITRIRVVFKFALDTGLVSRINGFATFKKPSKDAVRKERQKHELEFGAKVFSRAEMRLLLAHAAPKLRAMIYLGINCALGNHDVATLQASHIEGDKLCFPRPKTGLERESFLWGETLQAIDEAGGLPFKTMHGNLYVTASDNPLSKEFKKLMDACGIAGNRRGFYALRHTARTVLDETTDLIAIDRVMGHQSLGIGAQVYNHRVSDDRLRTLSEHLRKWLTDVKSQ